MIVNCRQLAGAYFALFMLCATAQASSIELPDIDINGFATVAGTGTNRNQVSYLDGGEDVSFDTDTMAGIQFSLKPNDRTEVVLQLVTRAEDDYKIEAEWAYVAFRLNEYSELRAGRLRIPFYLISDSLEVGYSYPWVRPPVDAYGQFAFSKFSGIDSLVRIPVGESLLVFHPHFGTSASDLELMGMAGSFNVTNLLGMNITWNLDWMTLRVGHTEGDYEVNDFAPLEPLADIMRAASGSSKVGDQFAIRERHGQFSGIGLDIDKDNIKIMAEYAERKTDGLMTDTASWYVMGGYRFGPIMPHLTYSDFETDTDYSWAEATIAGFPSPNKESLQQIVNFNKVNQRSVIAGLRYDVLPKVALKMEWQRTKPDKGSSLMSPPFLGADTLYMGKIMPGAKNLDDVDVYTIAVDLVF